MKKYFLIILTVLFMGCNPSDDDWVSLFNGKDLEGWHVYGAGTEYNGWHALNGTLAFDPSLSTDVRRSDLLTDRQYTNFELSLEWNIGEYGNSGLFWGVQEVDRHEHPYYTGPEIQILDENWVEYIEQNGDITRAGSLYGMIAPSAVMTKLGDEWNHFLLHIDHTENVGWLRFNDQEVLRFPVHGPAWVNLVAESRFREWTDFGKAKTGHICLQEYGGKVAFRNVKIRELPDES